MQNKLNRRRFLRLISSISLLPLLNSCSNPIISSLINGGKRYQPKPNADIFIEGDDKNIAMSLKNSYQKIKSIADNPGKELKIAYETNSGYAVLRMSFVKDNLADYPHLRIINDRTGEKANILWGMKGLHPSIKFVDDNGKIITKNGQRLEFQISSSSLPTTQSARDWLLLGFKIFAVALAIWLGLGIAKIIISALSFLAFNALVIGLLIVGLSVVIPLFKWILEVTGIKIEDVIAIFSQAVELIISTLLNIVDYLTNYFK